MYRLHYLSVLVVNWLAVCLLSVSPLELAYLNRNCGKSVKVNDSVRLKLAAMLTDSPDLDCSAVLYNDPKHQMMVRFLQLNIKESRHCHTSSLKLFNSPRNDTPMAVVCGHKAPTRTYVTSEKGKIQYVSREVSESERFDLLVTPFYTGLCDYDNSFMCDNKRCIADSLACDGYNNCGDNSDEKYNCGLSTEFIVAIALVSVAVLCLLVFSMYIFVSKKCGNNGYIRIL